MHNTSITRQEGHAFRRPHTHKQMNTHTHTHLHTSTYTCTHIDTRTYKMTNGGCHPCTPCCEGGEAAWCSCAMGECIRDGGCALPLTECTLAGGVSGGRTLEGLGCSGPFVHSVCRSSAAQGSERKRGHGGHRQSRSAASTWQPWPSCTATPIHTQDNSTDTTHAAAPQYTPTTRAPGQGREEAASPSTAGATLKCPMWGWTFPA